MHINLFNSIHTLDDIKCRLSILHEFAKERNLPFEDMLVVDGTDYKKLTYVLSSSKNGFLLAHYFTYEDESGNYVGLCEMPVVSKRLYSLAEPIYNKLINIHPNLWLGVDISGNYCVIVNGKVILNDIISYDLLSMGDCVQFLQLDSADGTSLVCLDMWNNISGVAPISSKEKFKEWFEFIVSRRGYEGKLDHLNISDLFQIYFDVINTIFTVNKFKPIGINE